MTLNCRLAVRPFLICFMVGTLFAWMSASVNAGLVSGQASPQPTELSTATTPEASFEVIRQSLTVFQGWDDLLARIDRIVRDNKNDPTARLKALEFLADVLPESTLFRKSSDGEIWADFCLEYCQQLSRQPMMNGTGQTEMSFRLVAALRELAPYLATVNVRKSGDLLLAVGTIGRNLHSNPAYPRQAISGLAPLLLAEAHGHAMQGNGDLARSTIQESLNWGLVEFEEVLDCDRLVNCSTGPAIKELVTGKQQAYRNQVINGVRSAISTFQPFQFRFSLPDLEGNQRDLSHYTGTLRVVDIWGTWCNPCRASLPHLIRLQKEFGDRGVRVVGVAMEPEPTVDEIRTKLVDFSAEHGINYDLVIGKDSVMQQIPGGGSLPTLLFVDEQGRVRFSTSGYHDYTQIRCIVEHLLETPVSPAR